MKKFKSQRDKPENFFSKSKKSDAYAKIQKNLDSLDKVTDGLDEFIYKDLYSEKTVLSPNYKPPLNADAATRKKISFNSPHNLGGLKKFVFPMEQEKPKSFI